MQHSGLFSLASPARMVFKSNGDLPVRIAQESAAHLLRLLGCALISLSLLSTAQSVAQDLPELSDTSALIMNAEQEKMFGKQIMLSVRASSTFSNDVLLIDYFSTLTQSIAIHSPRAFGKTITSLAVDPAINAFAVPGGYITINTGLIENTRNVDELASVIAHEIGHQSQRHISRSIERSKQLTIPATAALIGGLLLGGQAGTAAVLTSQAAVGADRLANSRTFEREADATGMAMLADAGYDPEAMPAFFGQLEEQSRLYGGIMPEFLSTHPVSSDRIADGMSRAMGLTPAAEIAPIPADRLDYAHAKIRARALYETPLKSVIQTLALATDDPDLNQKERDIARYGHSIALMRNGEYQRAESELTQLLQDQPGSPLLTLAWAELKLESGKSIEAEALYESLYQSDKHHPAYANGYAKSLALNGQYPAAIRILRKTIRHHPDSLWAYELLAESYAGDDKTMNALFTRAHMFKKIGMYTATINLLNQSTSRAYADTSDYLRASVDDLLRQTERAKHQLDQFKL